MDENQFDVEQAVRERYGEAARAAEPELCCPVEYDPKYLAAIPSDVLERDYGCGDPSRFVRSGDIVLDLGSGGGKICFIASQITGPTGRVIGVDLNGEMLDLARRSAPAVADAIGHANVEFRRGRIQDLALDLDAVADRLALHPVTDLAGLAAHEEWSRRQRAERPLVESGSVDLVVSNCVLNLVRDEDRSALIDEIHRVLRKGGRIAISDIVSDEVVPDELRSDPELWSGCVSGAFQELEFVKALESAGFYGIEIEGFDDVPWQTVQGIEFRSLTITARKGKEGPCKEANQAVIYRGPWKEVLDDDGHLLRRGERVAVCAKSYDILTSEPYAGEVIGVQPRVAIPTEARTDFDCGRTTPRHPRETKGVEYRETTQTCGTGCCC